MVARGIEARVTTYTAVVDACAKCGDVLRAETWMEKMIACGVEPNVVSYSAMIDACAKGGDPDRAELWHTRMLLKGVSPTLIHSALSSTHVLRQARLTRQCTG